MSECLGTGFKLFVLTVFGIVDFTFQKRGGVFILLLHGIFKFHARTCLDQFSFLRCQDMWPSVVEGSILCFKLIQFCVGICLFGFFDTLHILCSAFLQNFQRIVSQTAVL